MKARLLHSSLLFVLIFGVSAALLFGQSPASITWNIYGADSTLPTTVVGNLTGQAIASADSFAIIGYHSFKGTGPLAGVTETLRWAPYINGSKTSWGNETEYNPNRWVQFAVSPKSGNSLMVDTISIWLAGGGTSHIKANLFYSTDSTFATNTALVSTDTVLSLIQDSLKQFSYKVNATINNGETLYFRVYPWYDGSPSTSKYLYTQYAYIHGTTSPALISIKDARSMVDDTVKVTGVVISPNYQTTGRSYYIWDGTGGLATYIYGLTSPALKLGDSVFVTGKITVYNGLTEIDPLNDSSIVVIDSNATLPKPEIITINQFNNNGEDYESHLIAFSNLTKISGTWPTSKSSATLKLSDGKDTLTVYLDSDMGLYNSPEPTWPADVIGVGSQYASSGVGGYQLLPRYITDFMPAGSLTGPNLISIATARGMLNDTVKVTGVVISPNYQTTGRSYYIWDGTGGLATYIYGLTSPALKLGDSVFVTGEITVYNGLTEIDPLNDSSIVVIDSNATLPQPEVITIEQFNNNGEDYESHLIGFMNLTKLSGTWPTSKSSATLKLTDGKDTLTVYLDSDMGLYNSPEPTWPADVIGVGSQYASSGVGGYQLLPRYITDFMPAGTLPVELASFTADVMQRSVVLHWETATELNNSGFEVERSTDGKTFTSIAFVKGKGTSSEKTFYSFTDNNLITGSYYYRLKQIDFDGSAKYSNVIQADLTSAPAKFSLDQNYPNPFNPTTMISFTVEKTGITTLTIFNSLGQKVETLFNGQAETGQVYKINFNASRLSSGVYFYQLREGSNIITHKMMLMK